MDATEPTESRTYTVAGMTCSHCVSSVREELSEVAGVDSVDVDLASGHVVVSGRGVVDDAVKAAVEEAGYQLGTRRAA
jgi:copper chaperone